MAKAKKRPAKKKTASKKVVTSAALSKNIDASLAGLNAASADSTKAINIRAKEVKTLATEIAQLSKKRMILLKRKKSAANKLKKDKNAQNRKALNAVVKEIAGIAKLSNKAKMAKNTTAPELAGLKADQKRVTAYIRALENADKALNKPKKKVSRKKPAAKAKVAVMPTMPTMPTPVVDIA